VVQSTQNIKQSFDRDGFVAISSFLNSFQIEQVQKRIRDYVHNVLPYIPYNHAFYEDKARPETLKHLLNISHHDPIFGRMFFSEPFVDLAELLLNGPVRASTLQWFNKPPTTGQPTPPHQDGYYFMLEPNEALTMWLALDSVDNENGCVRYIGGSHLRGIRPHAHTNTLGFSQGISDYGDDDRAIEVAMHAQPGDLLVHHSLTIHRADGNNSKDRSRQALGFVYFARRAQEDTVKQEAYQKALSAEMAAKGKL